MDCSDSCPISKTETIVLAADGSLYSERAVRESIRFAGPCSSRIIAVMAFESKPEHETTGSSVYDAQVVEARTFLTAVKEQADKASVPCETVLHSEAALREAVAIAKRCGSSLLLLSAMCDESARTEAEPLVRRAAAWT